MPFFIALRHVMPVRDVIDFMLILFAHSRPPPMGELCMGNRDLAIFDFDGTIADSAEWFGNALNELARHNGFREISAEQREMLRGVPPEKSSPILKFPPENCRSSSDSYARSRHVMSSRSAYSRGSRTFLARSEAVASR